MDTTIKFLDAAKSIISCKDVCEICKKFLVANGFLVDYIGEVCKPVGHDVIEVVTAPLANPQWSLPIYKLLTVIDSIGMSIVYSEITSRGVFIKGSYSKDAWNKVYDALHGVK